jgi:hypothetical protein
MRYLILYIILIAGVAVIENRKSKRIRTRMGWLKSSRCSTCGATLRFEPFNWSDA